VTWGTRAGSIVKWERLGMGKRDMGLHWNGQPILAEVGPQRRAIVAGPSWLGAPPIFSLRLRTGEAYRDD
jgi:hypothetical protein